MGLHYRAPSQSRLAVFWNGFPSPTQGSEGVDSHKSLYEAVQCPEIKESNSFTVFPDRLFPAEEGRKDGAIHTSRTMWNLSCFGGM